ncbi:MAG: acyltransferase family protein [Pseudomonadota bacterium]
MTYRADIDGLRAIAVMAVVLFHLDVLGFQGGYVGVDVFFVISGYLITSIIKNKFDNQEFRFSDFYARRVRRLLPPLIVTVGCTFVGASFVLLPSEMREFSRSAVAALFSVSNIVFYFEAGYWDKASELKPLLHTWSLGIEEQFYLFWPALIVGLLSIQRILSFGASLLVITLLGTALCIWYTGVNQSAAFYLLPFRVFQFSMGALLIPLAACISPWVKAQGSQISAPAVSLGVFLIMVSVFSLDGETDFPGWAALLPTLGSALVMLGGALSIQPNTLSVTVMQNSLSVWLGQVSYSLYLVHWPLIALYRYQYGLELELSDQLILAVSIAFATLMLHYGVEKRFYQRVGGNTPDSCPKPDNAQVAVRVLLCGGLLALLIATAWNSDGWSWRYASLRLSTEQIEQGQVNRTRHYRHACTLLEFPSGEACNSEATVQVLVLGNSHETDAYNFLNAAYGGDKNVNLIAYNYPIPCGGVTSAKQSKDKAMACKRWQEKLFDPATIASLDMIIYAANRPYHANKKDYLSLLEQLKQMKQGLSILTYGGYINTDRDCAFYTNLEHSTDACAMPENVDYFEADSKDKHLIANFRALESHYIDRVALLCERRSVEACLTRTPTGVPAFYDRHHISLEFSEMSGKMYAAQYPNLLHEFAGRR